MQRLSILAVLGLVVFGGLPPAQAEEEATATATFPDRAPPSLVNDAHAFRGEVERPDLIEYVKTLRRALAEYEKPAPRTNKITALHDAWSKILRPRARRMTKRLEKWQDRRRWSVPPGERTPTGLDPEQWPTFTRDMASLVTELHGAWKQYGTVKLRDKEVGLGIQATPRAPRLPRFGYANGVHHRGIRARQHAGWSVGRYDMGSYWHLLNRYQGAWVWRLQRRAEYDAWLRKQAQVRRDTFQAIRTDYENTRESLVENMLGIQALVAAMQNAEEERILGIYETYPEHDTLREMAEIALRKMEEARLDAEDYEGDSSARYGTLIRTWLRVRKAALDLTKIADKELMAAEDAEADGE